MKPMLHLSITALMLLAAMSGFGLAADPDTFSPVVSYQYLDSLSEPGTETNIASPVVSYQYFDWPGDENLAFTNSPNVSYYFNGPPQIVTQPTGQLLRVGAMATLSVVADGTPPLSYQWRFNGQPLPDTSGATIALDNLQTTDSGVYSVVVSNAAGSVTSRDSRLIIYDAPTTPQPPPPGLPAVNGTTLPPTLTTAPRIPSSTQLKVFNTGGQVDRSKMTIVLTHGWKSSSDEWPMSMKNALIAKGYDAGANILAWDWRDDALTNSPSTAAARTLNQGDGLGAELFYLLGATYDKPIHFIGHSLGTILNCEAADYIHGDAKNSPAKLSGSSLKYSPKKTHMTLFDEAELVQPIKGIHLSFNILFKPTGDTTADLINNFWTKVIPVQFGWVDNYLSQVGLIHSNASNILLWRKTYLNPSGPHRYSYEWYKETVTNPLGSIMGHRWSSERNSLGSAPGTPSYYLQSLDLSGSEMTVGSIPGSLAESLSTGRLAAYPSLKAYQGLNAIGAAVQGVYLEGIQYAGNMVADFAETLSAPTGTPVYLATEGSTAAYFLPTGQTADTNLQASWDLQFSIQQGAPQPQQIAKGVVAMPAPAPSAGPVYTIIPAHVPNEAVGVSFEYNISGPAVDEFMTMGIGTSNEYTMEAKFLDDDTWNGTPIIPISDQRNQDVQLVFALNGASGTPTGTLSVRNIQFYIPPRPEVTLDKAGNALTASWPLSALDWTLETSTDLSDPNGWEPVSAPPTDTDFSHTMLFDVTGSNRAFFRLKK